MNKWSCIFASIAAICVAAIVATIVFTTGVVGSINKAMALPPTISEFKMDKLQVTDEDNTLITVEGIEASINSRLIDIITGFIIPGSDY